MGAKITFGGKDSVGPLIDAITRKVEGMEKGLSKVSKQSKATQRDAERLWKQAQTPLERYNSTLKRAKALLDGSSEGQRKHAAVVAMANRKLREQQSFFGSKSVSQLRAYAGGWLSVAAAMGAVTRAFTDAKQARDALAATQGAGAQGTAQLAQIAGSVKGGMPAVDRMVQSMRVTQGLEEGAASDLIFSLGSAPGALKERKFFGGLAGRGAVRDLPGLIKSAAAFRSNFPSRNLSYERVTDILLSAAKANPARAQELGTALGPVTQLAGKAGISPEEVSAATALLATGSTSPDIAATQVRGILAAQITSPELQGKSLQEMAQMASTMSLPELKGIFTDRRALVGMASLSGQAGRLGTFTKEIGGDTGISRRIMNAPGQIGRLESQFQLRRAIQARDVASERVGIAATSSQAAIARIETGAAMLGEGATETSHRQTGARWLGAAARWFSEDPAVVGAAAQFGSTGSMGLISGAGGFAASIMDGIREIGDNTGRGDLQTVEN